MAILFQDIKTDIITILAVIIGLLYCYLTSFHSFWKSKNIPYIKPEILFGNMKDIVTFKVTQTEKFLEYHRYFRSLGFGYGGIFELRTPMLLICTPEMVKDVAVKNFFCFHDRGVPHDEHFDPLAAHLVNLDGQKWKFIRSKLTPAFSTGKLRTMHSSFLEAGDVLLRVWEKASDTGESLNIRELMAQYTTDVIGLCAFGLQLNSIAHPNSDFRRMGRKYFESSKKQKIREIIVNVYPWMYKLFKLRRVSKDISDFFINALRETMAHRKKNNIEKNDFLGCLMKIKDATRADITDMKEMSGVDDYNTTIQEGAIELTEGVIAAQAFIFFIAGFETSSTTLSFCMQELAENPDIQEKVQKELDESFKKHGRIDVDFVQNLKYMDQVLQETLRKYPAVPFTTRICTKEYKLPDSNAVLCPGTRVMLAPYSMHHSEEYFPDPEKFEPERFSPENKEKIIPYSYIPFGEGPRICIGMRFAMLEMKTVLAQILLKYKLTKCEETKPIKLSKKTFILTPTDGIWLKTVKRSG